MKKEFKEIIVDVGERLRSEGIADYFAESRALAAKVLNRPVNQIHPDINIELSYEQFQQLSKLAERRIMGEPLQLICGYVGFHNIILNCEKGVFIPRMETETLVNRALNCIDEIPPDKTARILDLGTGTGAIVIALAVMSPRHQYFGVDLNEKSIQLARLNAEMNDVVDKVDFYKGDYFDPVRSWEDIRFELIVSNPAYIRSSDIPHLDSEVRDWDPRIALDGGEDGLDEYRKIAGELSDFLHPDGTAIFEIDPEYVEPLEILFKKSGFRINGVHKDLDGNERIIEVIFL
ncbi:MAG: peptide chain release factor N(5)-glutamine methyltransferase [bacterium]